MTIEIVYPDWPAPKKVLAFSTRSTTQNPISVKSGTIEGLQGRLQLEVMLQSQYALQWPAQVHSANVKMLPDNRDLSHTDAVYTRLPGVVCAISTADCLPVIICNTVGTIVANIHAGWRGLQQGIISNTVKHLDSPPHDLLVWFGPAISQTRFEVGPELFDAFIRKDEMYASCFVQGAGDRYFADLYQIARCELHSLGIGLSQIYGGTYCTYDDKNFHSHRRDGVDSGRLATIIMIKP